MISHLTHPFIPDTSVVRRAERIIAQYARTRVEIVFNRACGFSDESLDGANDAIERYAEENLLMTKSLWRASIRSS